MENSLEISKYDEITQNDSFKLLNTTKNIYNELPINDSIKKRKLDELHIISENTTSTIIDCNPENKKEINFYENEINISEYLKCDVCNVTKDNNTNIVYCSYCELMSELRNESIKILKLKGIIDFLKKISTKERPKEYLESLIQNSMYFIYISKKNINYPEHIKILFTNILNKNYYPFYEYFKNKDLKNEVQYFLPNNLNYYFIFLNMLILFYLKKGWGWDITLFPSDKSKIIQYIEDKCKELKKEYHEKVNILKIEIYRLENWIFTPEIGSLRTISPGINSDVIEDDSSN
jgi:hypothetical protein